MDYARSIHPIGSLETQSAELIREAQDTGQPIILVQDCKPAAVLQDVETFQRQRKALILLRILAQSEKGFDEGRSLSHAEVKRKLFAESSPSFVRSASMPTES